MRTTVFGCRPLFAALLWLGLCIGVVTAAEWPCYQADPQRSGIMVETLAYPLALAWQYQPSQRPQPAWPEPGRTLHLTDFDYAFQPVSAGGLVFFGSSADDSVRALDRSTGRLRWRFIARGPIRFAPHIADGRCFFAGDDGYVYCLEAQTGRLVWELRVASDDRPRNSTAFCVPVADG